MLQTEADNSIYYFSEETVICFGAGGEMAIPGRTISKGALKVILTLCDYYGFSHNRRGFAVITN